jgi:histidine triad (HIT) family protein
MTLFEKISARQIPATIEYEDTEAIVLRDVNPQAPVHLLVVPKRPITRVGEAGADDAALLGHLLIVAGQAANKAGLHESGYRLVINHGRDAGETIPHLHIHVLGGRTLAWPPG